MGWSEILVVGFLVGLGICYVSGCISGYGVCGILCGFVCFLVVILIFMVVGFLIVFV